MRTHKATGVSLPSNMEQLAKAMAAAKGLKWSAYMQQLLIREIKAEHKGMTTEEIMGTDDAEMEARKPVKLTPEQRVALAKIELAKARKAKAKK